MSLWLLANTVGRASAQIVASDTSDVAISDQSKVGIVRGGPRHLKWTSDHATAARRIAYVEKGGSLVADFCVVVDAKAHDGSNLKVIEFTAYGGTESNLDSRTLGTSDYVGIGRQDFVYKFSSKQSSKQGFAVEFGGTSYRKTARQVFFAEGIEFSEHPDGSQITVQPVSIHEQAFTFKGHPYHLYAQASIVFTNVTRATLDAYQQLKQNHPEPMFLYDSSGTASIGNAIEHKLWHCVIDEDVFTPINDDAFNVEMTLGILRSWL